MLKKMVLKKPKRFLLSVMKIEHFAIVNMSEIGQLHFKRKFLPSFILNEAPKCIFEFYARHVLYLLPFLKKCSSKCLFEKLYTIVYSGIVSFENF